MDTKKNRLYGNGRCYNPLIHPFHRSVSDSVAVIGAGTIGPDIAYYLKSALPEIRLYLVDVAEKPLEKARFRLEGYTKKAVDRKKMTAEFAAKVLENIEYTLNYGEVRDCGLVIEAATERLDLKRRIFSQVEALVDASAIITSNTSSIPADRLFSGLKHPERTTVTHFFAPAWRNPVVEIIDWEKADRSTIDFLFRFFAETGKVPIITDNVICFMFDRIFDNWCNESAFLLEKASAGQIDSVAGEFVHAGPFFVLNMANGNPIIIETNTLQMEEGEHYEPARILASVDRWNTIRPGTKLDVPDALRKSVRDRLLGILFSQSFDIVDRGIGTRADLNFGCVAALGFRKGPLDVMRDLGESETERIMDAFEKDRPGFPKPENPVSGYMDFMRHILVDQIENVLVITIRRPQAMNAINDEVTDEILAILKENVENPSIKGFVLTGYGTSAFSAGADIGKFPEMLGNREAAYQYPIDCAKVQLFMDEMKKPVVAAINGVALGGGLELAIRCHGIVSMRKAVFGFPEVTLGIAPGIGGCVVPYRKWPGGGALFHEMLLSGKRVSAEVLYETGMISKIADDYPEMIRMAVAEVKSIEKPIPVPDGRVDVPEIVIPDSPVAGNLVLSRETVSMIADIIKKGSNADTFQEALDIGYRCFADIACMDSAKEGITAFLEKRRPVFTK